MDSEASSFGAANLRHHRYMVFGKKQRYIEVFQCSGEDMSLVLTGGAQQQKPPLLSPGMLDAQGAAPPPPAHAAPSLPLTTERGGLLTEEGGTSLSSRGG